MSREAGTSELREAKAAAQPASRGYANYVLGVLFLVYVFNFVDRQILAILLGNIKTGLSVSDTAMGFLTGMTFALFYIVTGIPICRRADLGVRRSVIAAGLARWSAMTAVSGLVQNFTQLAIARVGVGVGEAACPLADYRLFPSRAACLRTVDLQLRD